MAERAHRPEPVRRCDECREVARISVRGVDGEPDLCKKCARLELALCGLCGELRRCYYAQQPQPICRCCAPNPTAGCAHCDKRRRIAALSDRGPVCAGCRRAAARGRPRCQCCRRSRQAVAIIDGAPICAACADTRTTQRCRDCATDGRNWSEGRCPDCALGDELARLRATGDPDAVARLAPLLATLRERDKPKTALAWLQHSLAAPTLRGLLLGEIAISHEALDEHDVGQATAYLRSWLVADGVGSCQPPDEESHEERHHDAEHGQRANAAAAAARCRSHDADVLLVAHRLLDLRAEVLEEVDQRR